jgi:hypothetical protein
MLLSFISSSPKSVENIWFGFRQPITEAFLLIDCWDLSYSRR